jgi:hypothetical protein
MFAFTFKAPSYVAAREYVARKGLRARITYLVNGVWLAERA